MSRGRCSPRQGALCSRNQTAQGERMKHQQLSRSAFYAALACASLLAACGQVPTDQPPPPVAEAPAAAEPAAPPCPPVLADRNWKADLARGARATLTIEGQIDLPTPG